MSESIRQKKQIFVANRVREILESLSRYTKSSRSRTRGIRANEIASILWQYGPAWLRESEDQWPKATIKRTIVEDTLETTQMVVLLPNKPLQIQWERFGS